MNARLSNESQVIDQLPCVNLGMAVDTERGLLVPVIRNADQKSLRAFGTSILIIKTQLILTPLQREFRKYWASRITYYTDCLLVMCVSQ